MEAAITEHSDSLGPPFLVYIESLVAQITKQSLRKHKLYIGIQNKELTVVLEPRCRNEKERSFCVSVDASCSGQNREENLYLNYIITVNMQKCGIL